MKYKETISSTPIQTAYFGGGTPSMLSPGHLRFLMDGLHEIFDFSNAEEIAFEANPATFQLKKAQLFRELGISRISLGIQSFDNAVLKTLGREHNREQAIEAVQSLQQAKLSEINIDLMFSIPGQTIESWQDSLETAINLRPHHISAYNLTYEEDTEFIERLTKGDYTEDNSTNAHYFHLGHDLLTSAGFQHYETSNYAQIGKQSKHNLSYWQGADYLGIGPSAVSTINGQRWKNTPDTERYIQQIAHVGHAKTEHETIDPAAYRLERIALLLRTEQGLPMHWLDDLDPLRIQQLCEEDLGIIKKNHLILHKEGRLLVDSIVEHLLR